MGSDITEITQSMTKPTSRVLSLDVLRGLTIALMILVNDPGDWKHVFSQLDHATWNGCTLTDLVFPTFLFLLGAAMVFSLEARRSKGDCRVTLIGHLFARAGKIYLLGLLLAYFPRMQWHSLRLYGVLPRIALCSLLAGLVLLATRDVRALAGTAAVLLLGYWLLLRWMPVPGIGMPGRDMPFMDPNLNLAAWMDRGFLNWTQHWLHTGSLYNKTRDPEGWLSTLPAVGTVLLGALTGIWMKRVPSGGASPARMRAGLVFAGIAALLSGFIWAHWFPLNKNLWTSSYVLVSAGWALLALALASWLVDGRLKPWTAWRRAATEPWLIFGSNAIAAYTVAAVLVKLAIYFRVQGQDGRQRTLWNLAYVKVFARNGSTEWTSLLFALTFVAICFLPNWLLWRKRVFLRL